MLTSVAGRVKAPPVNQNRFDRILSSVWWKSGNQPRLGLAISGGVDSMALASLCSKSTIAGKTKPKFTAFIVDHCLRQGSDEEAENVSRVLSKMSIESKILKLDWSSVSKDPKHLANMESVARTLRFQALGKACRDSDIKSLLLAHHGDDQAETVFSRLISGYTGSGFRGIKSESRIPECHGIYGVCESGAPHTLLPTTLGRASSPLQIESGGIYVHRPLLEFQKTELIATCQRNGVQWFEDPTNADKGLTLRNTIRHLWGNDRLPYALSSTAMLEMAQRTEERTERRDAEAEAIFNDCDIELDIRSGCLNLKLPSNIKERLFAPSENETKPAVEAAHRAARLLRRILMLVAPRDAISLQDLQGLTESMFPLSTESYDGSSLHDQPMPSIAGLYITRIAISKPITLKKSPNIEDATATTAASGDLPAPSSTTSSDAPKTSSFNKNNNSSNNNVTTLSERPTFVYRIERERSPTRQMSLSTVSLVQSTSSTRASSTDLSWSPWHLFDNRFWLRIRHRPFNLSPHRSIVVRFLQKQDVEALRKTMDKRDVGFAVARMRHAAPGRIRFTLPVIVERYSVAGAKTGKVRIQEDICALPTIGWGKKGWRPWKGRGGDEEGEEEEADVPWSWECRYKMIEFGKGKGHAVKAPDLIADRLAKGVSF